MKIVPHLCLAVLICAALLTLSRNTDWIHPAPASPVESFALDDFTESSDRGKSGSDIDPFISIVSLADLPRQTVALEIGFQSADVVTLACRSGIENPDDAKSDNQNLVTAVREVWVE